MKRAISLLSALAFVLIFSGSTFAQAVTASANVISDLSYTVDQQLNFGDLESDFSGATLDPTGTSSDNNLNQGYQAGRITISGSNDQDVNVSLDVTSLLLTNSGSSDILSLSPTISGAGGDSDAARGGGTSSSSSVSLTLDGSGAGEVWVGGNLSVDTDDGSNGLDAVTYTNDTDLTVTLDYTFSS